ncbi:putative importin subunit beta-4 [Podosphaera aphanis]|nr:putative importin subunit beta-4 [Podosphaera aphanis]
MDQQKFLELLQNIQVPDTERVKAATTELRKIYYPNPTALLWLLHILTSHDAPEMRQQAAVEALRIIHKHWGAIEANQKPAIRENLLQFTLNEQKSLVCHASARLIAAIAGIDISLGEWPQLPGLLAQAATSEQVAHRKMGTFVLYSLLDDTFEIFQDKISDLFQIFTKTINDTESTEVRINTLLCLSKIATEADESEDSIDRLNDILPNLVTVLKSAIEEENDDLIMQSFELFHTFLGCEPSILNKHFSDLLNFMIEMASNTKIPDESRTQAVSFLMQCARFRKMKIQGLKGMGEALTLMSLQIATEISDDEDDDDDDITPSKSALGLLDILSTSLPPRQVIVPLLNALPQYVQNPNPKYRQAGISALGMCVEGAPDFIGTQLDQLMKPILSLLDDSEIRVRGAALNGIARLADDLAEDLCKHHEHLIPALVKNLEASSLHSFQAGPESFKSIDVLKSSCSALDSVCRGIDKKTMIIYISDLVSHIGKLLSHPDLNVKASAAGALGSIAESAGDAFLPYFDASMQALSGFVTIKDSTEELDLRGIVCDALGSMATAVGPEVFKPFVTPLMQASEEGLHLGHPRLRETSYILWSTLAKVYATDFNPFLEGVIKGIMDCLEQDEVDNHLEDGPQELLGEEVSASKKVKSACEGNSSSDSHHHHHDEDDDSCCEDEFANNAVAMEKEVAIEVLGDVMSYTRRDFMPYFEKTVMITLGLVGHGYDGVRKGAISTLWRSYACHWALMEDESGKKWTPGLPLNEQPSPEALKLGELISSATTSLWEDETNRAVVTDINRNVAATLKLCGPAILTHNKFTERLIATCTALITKSHPCQQDFGDEVDCAELENEESSEYDWLVIDTALDVIIGLSKALGGQFSEAWKIFQKPVMKFASSHINYERSTAVGVIAECTSNMGETVTPYTNTLLTLLLHRLTDEDAETKSNAAYALGLLIYHSAASNEYLGSYMTILTKLEPLLQTPNYRTIDNAVGCICRMILAHIDHVPVDTILPALVDLLPLKEDYEENVPIYDCITGLYQQSHPVMLSLTPKIIPVFSSVLGEPKDQLESSSRHKIIDTLKFIASTNPSLLEGNETLLMALNEFNGNNSA